MERIMINGRSLAGKDTIADYLVKEYGFKKISFAEPIYKIAEKYFSMKKKDRDLLQKIGEKFREIDPDIWVKLLLKRINKHNRFIISDTRQTNEYLICKGEDFIPVRVKSNLDLRIERCKKRDGIENPDISLWENDSETGADDFNYHEIDNNSTFEDLYKQIDKLCEKLKIKKPIDFQLLDKVKIVKVANTEKANHLTKYIGCEGHIFSYIHIEGNRKYKVVFGDFSGNESAYFFGNELELVK